MLVKPFAQKIDPEKVFALQKFQYQEDLLMRDEIAAGATKMGKVGVSNLGHFFCMNITGAFTCLGSPVAAIVDTGVTYLSGQLIDGAGQRKLFNDKIPFDLFLTPGRRKDANSTTVVADPQGNNLFVHQEFEYLFTANSDILLEVYNASDETNYYEIRFHGIRIISDMVIRNQIVPGGGIVKRRIQPPRRG